MTRFSGKIAVFICGPARYVGHVTRRLEQVMTGYEYDCFYHIWKADLGNKLRQQEETDLSSIQASPRTKVLIRQEPYSVEDFVDSVGTMTDSGSTINATMGMFFSVNVLCHYLELIPDSDKYSHILRLRTDCAIINDHFAELLDPTAGVLTTGKACIVPPDWVSDHIAFGDADTFRRLWQFGSMTEIYKAYTAAGRNPERTLAARLRDAGGAVQLNRAMVLFKDYHIVYHPPRGNEPKWILDAIESAGIPGFFSRASLYYNAAETDAIIAQHNDRWRSSSLLSAFRSAADKPDGILQDMQAGDIAGMLIRGYHDNPDMAQRLLAYIEPRLDCQVLHQMLDECRRTYHEWNDGAAWLEEPLSRRLQATELYLAGCQKLRERAYGEAITQLEASLALNVTIPNIHYAMAAAFAQLGRYGSAICSCRQELQVQPGHRAAMDFLGRLEKTIEAAGTLSGNYTGTVSPSDRR